MKFEKFYADATNSRIESIVSETNINDRDSIRNAIKTIELEISSQLDRADNKVDYTSLQKLNVLHASYSILLK